MDLENLNVQKPQLPRWSSFWKCLYREAIESMTRIRSEIFASTQRILAPSMWTMHITLSGYVVGPGSDLDGSSLMITLNMIILPTIRVLGSIFSKVAMIFPRKVEVNNAFNEVKENFCNVQKVIQYMTTNS